MLSEENFQGMAVKRLRRELELMNTNSAPGISAGPVGDNMFEMEANITGPVDSPYAGGVFFLRLSYPKDYPIKPPTVTFATKIYHPNIDPESGHISLDTLEHEWVPVLTIEKILLSILALLTNPNAKEPLIKEAGDLYLTDRDKFDKIAEEWTRAHAW